MINLDPGVYYVEGTRDEACWAIKCLTFDERIISMTRFPDDFHYTEYYSPECFEDATLWDYENGGFFMVHRPRTPIVVEGNPNFNVSIRAAVEGDAEFNVPLFVIPTVPYEAGRFYANRIVPRDHNLYSWIKPGKSRGKRFTIDRIRRAAQFAV